LLSTSCRPALSVASVLAVLAGHELRAQWTLDAKFVPTAYLRDYLHIGVSVDLSGNGTRAIAGGCVGGSSAGNVGGTVMLLKEYSSGWGTQISMGYDSTANYGFATAIADAGYAVIGAPTYYPQYGDYGAVYFGRDTTVAGIWEETEHTFTTSSGLGQAVDIYGSFAVVGLPRYLDKGLVEVYQRQSSGDWTVAKLLAPTDLSSGDLFGWSVAITYTSGNYLLAVGAPSQGLQNTGSVYVYKRALVDTDWTLEQKITIPSSVELGGSIALDGDAMVVGEMMGSGAQSGARAAILQRADGVWSVKRTLLLDANGNSVSQRSNSVLSGAVAVYGSHAAFGASGSSRVLVYFKSSSGSWGASSTPVLSGPSGSKFGYAVDMSSDRMIVGAPAEASVSGYQQSGAVYIYKH